MAKKEASPRELLAEASIERLVTIYTSHYYNPGNQKKPTVNFHHMDGLGLPELLDRQERHIHIVRPQGWDVFCYVQTDQFYMTYRADVDENTPGFLIITPRAARVFVLATTCHATGMDHQYIVKFYPSYQQSPICLFKEYVPSPMMLDAMDKLYKLTYETYLDMITGYRDVDRVIFNW